MASHHGCSLSFSHVGNIWAEIFGTASVKFLVSGSRHIETTCTYYTFYIINFSAQQFSLLRHHEALSLIQCSSLWVLPLPQSPGEQAAMGNYFQFLKHVHKKMFVVESSSKVSDSIRYIEVKMYPPILWIPKVTWGSLCGLRFAWPQLFIQVLNYGFT